MIRGLATLILLGVPFFTQSRDDAEQISWTAAKPGDNVTILSCSLPTIEIKFFYWYKLSFGYAVQTVAVGTSEKVRLQGQFVDSRFSATKVDTVYSLNIANVRKEDEAAYFCQAGSAYETRFINGTILTVDDLRIQQKFVYVKENLQNALMKPRDSMTLQCSNQVKKENPVQCPDEQTVHWFRVRSAALDPDSLYTYRDSSALVTCGHILFCEEKETRQEMDPVVIVLGILLAFCIVVIAVLIFSRDQR